MSCSYVLLYFPSDLVQLNKMSGSWSTEETRTLISIWGDESVQSCLDSAHRNRHIFEQIAREMSEKGYEKTWQQYRTKMKNLTQKYRKV